MAVPTPAPPPPLIKIDHCGRRRRLRFLLRRGNMNILVRASIVFAIYAVYWILDYRWRISSKVQNEWVALFDSGGIIVGSVKIKKSLNNNST